MKKRKFLTRALGRLLGGSLAAVMAAGLCLYPLRVRADDQPPPEQEEYENGWDHVYQFPVPDEEIFIHDKTLPLSEVIKKLSAPSTYISPETVGEFGEFPLLTNEYVQAYIAYFTGSNRGGFKRAMIRSGLYEAMIKNELKKRGMPEELFYLCLIESGFNPTINSWAGAGGLWQFIRSTGRKFGLDINYWVDERYDPVKSTRAALDYLSYLHDFFGGDWHLAAASYNAGEAKIDRELRNTGCSDYWCLCEQKALKLETRNYLPQMIAAAIIAHNPERYGFYNLEVLPPLQYSTVTVDEAVDLRVLARCAGTSSSEIQRLNPELLQFCTPPGQKYAVNIPVGSVSRFRNEYLNLRPEDKIAFKKHKVEAGQSIKSIAAGYQTSSTMLASMNNLSVGAGLREGQVLTVPAPRDAVFNPNLKPSRKHEYEPDVRSYTRPDGKRRPQYERGKRIVHNIEVGETLSEIAETYGVATEDLRKCNGLKNSTSIFYGDTLWICGSTKKPLKTSPNAGVSKIIGPTRTFKYKVRNGDRCYFIARYYGIHSQDIIVRNKLDPQCSIRPGQTLTLVVPKDAPHSLPPTSDDASCEQPSSSAHSTGSAPSRPDQGSVAPAGKGTLSYTVKEGESLWMIAKKFDAHMADIKDMNNLSSDSVRPGQKIKIKPGSEYRGPMPRKPETSPQPKAKPPVAEPPAPQAAGTPAPQAKCSTKITHTVQPGESLWAIAKKYDAYSADIKAMNGLESDSLRSGQKLVICPGSEYKSGSSSSASTAPGGSTKGKKKLTYTVKEGETLWQIARDHDVHVAEIKQWNNLSSNSVRPGQKLVIYQ